MTVNMVQKARRSTKKTLFFNYLQTKYNCTQLYELRRVCNSQLQIHARNNGAPLNVDLLRVETTSIECVQNRVLYFNPVYF